MRYKLSAPATLHTTIQLPASKSISNRALILHALAQGHIAPSNLSDCDDTRVMIKALDGNPGHIDILAAGTAMRFLTAYLSVTPGTRIITGTERMQQRPIRILVDALRELGAQIEYAGKEGFPPLRITGTELTGEEISLAGNVSSQYISALLMIGPILKNGLRLNLTGEIISRPYINLTLQLMKEFGADAAWSSESSITVRPEKYRDIPFTVESDWSGASYWYQMVALIQDNEKKESTKTEIKLPGLLPRSYQGDSRGAEIFAKLGVHTTYTDQGVILTKMGTSVTCLKEDLVDIPDLAQTFVVTCCLMNIPFRFTGLQSLKIKETDRIQALITELNKLGYVVKSEQDSILIWNGERCEPASHPVIATYEDHRMAMAFAPAILRTPSIRIADPQVVSKSYPGYWEDLKQVGFGIEIEEKTMWILIISLIALVCIALLAGYIRNQRLQKKIERGELDAMPEVKEADAECCGQHEICERDSLLAAVSKKIEYYDDEELDKYIGIAPEDYTPEQEDEFRDVFYTMQDIDVAGWVRSLQLRGIALPNNIKDEIFLIIGERRF